MQLANYLFFTTMCEPALAFYSECGLGHVTLLVRHGDGGLPVHNEAMRGKVMHSKFAGPGIEFYASDNDDAEPMRGSAHMLTLDNRALRDAVSIDPDESGVPSTKGTLT